MKNFLIALWILWLFSFWLLVWNEVINQKTSELKEDLIMWDGWIKELNVMIRWDDKGWWLVNDVSSLVSSHEWLRLTLDSYKKQQTKEHIDINRRLNALEQRAFQ